MSTEWSQQLSGVWSLSVKVITLKLSGCKISNQAQCWSEAKVDLESHRRDNPGVLSIFSCPLPCTAQINASRWPHLRAIRSQPVSCLWLRRSRETPSACLFLSVTQQTWEGAINAQNRGTPLVCAPNICIHTQCVVKPDYYLPTNIRFKTVSDL